MNDQLKEEVKLNFYFDQITCNFQWEKAMAESIPLFFHGVEHIQDDMESIAFLMEMPDSDESSG